MALTEAGAALTRSHRQRQIALRAATLRDLIRLWPSWRLGDIDSYERFILVTSTLVRARNRDSSALGAAYYQAYRIAENIRGEATPRLAARPTLAQITKSIDATGRAGIMRALEAGYPIEAARRNGFVRVSGAMGRLVMNGGRHTLVESSAADRRARGWSRVTGGDPCSFCQAHANGGVVFSEEAASFQAHDHCSCTAEPNYA